MSAGADLLAEGTDVHVAGGGTEKMKFTMLSLVKLEQQFGGLGGIAEVLPQEGLSADSIPPDMFTKIMELIHLGFLHKGWTFEETCAQLLPRYFNEYTEALGKELNFGGGDDSSPKQ
jgi:hypothetical protein